MAKGECLKIHNQKSLESVCNASCRIILECEMSIDFQLIKKIACSRNFPVGRDFYVLDNEKKMDLSVHLKQLWGDTDQLKFS